MTTETDTNDGEHEGDLQLSGIAGVTWTDDDGTTYERKLVDGDIVDQEVMN